MRVVVTGGAGFVGSHLCDALIARGDRSSALITSRPATRKCRTSGRPSDSELIEWT